MKFVILKLKLSRFKIYSNYRVIFSLIVCIGLLHPKPLVKGYFPGVQNLHIQFWRSFKEQALDAVSALCFTIRNSGALSHFSDVFVIVHPRQAWFRSFRRLRHVRRVQLVLVPRTQFLKVALRNLQVLFRALLNLLFPSCRSRSAFRTLLPPELSPQLPPNFFVLILVQLTVPTLSIEFQRLIIFIIVFYRARTFRAHILQ